MHTSKKLDADEKKLHLSLYSQFSEILTTNRENRALSSGENPKSWCQLD